MIRLKFSIKDDSLDIIDNFDSMPGTSGQVTAFRQHILHALRLRLTRIIADLNARHVEKNSPEWINSVSDTLKILNNNRFVFKTCTVKDGTIINEYEFKGDED